jgi:hypothetical protein
MGPSPSSSAQFCHQLRGASAGREISDEASRAQGARLRHVKRADRSIPSHATRGTHAFVGSGRPLSRSADDHSPAGGIGCVVDVNGGSAVANGMLSETTTLDPSRGRLSSSGYVGGDGRAQPRAPCQQHNGHHDGRHARGQDEREARHAASRAISRLVRAIVLLHAVDGTVRRARVAVDRFLPMRHFAPNLVPSNGDIRMGHN